MGIISFLVIGLLAGWLAGKIMKGRGFGLVGNLVVGVFGALTGGFLFRLLGVAAYGFWGSLTMSVFGAVVLLYLITVIRR